MQIRYTRNIAYAVLALASIGIFTLPAVADKPAGSDKPATSGIPALVNPAGKETTAKDGLKYQDIVVGKGDSPKSGQTVTVNYTGWLTDGTKFDASADHGGTFDFAIGVGQVIKGWDEGVITMKVGGKRRLTIPPALGYGEAGAGGLIPPNATLVFDVELISLK